MTNATRRRDPEADGRHARMTDNASTGLPARAPKARDESSPVRAGDIPVARLQQVKDAVAGVAETSDRSVVDES
jgi:hypothetical protein